MIHYYLLFTLIRICPDDECGLLYAYRAQMPTPQIKTIKNRAPSMPDIPILASSGLLSAKQKYKVVSDVRFKKYTHNT